MQREVEEFWKGEFGAQYRQRHTEARMLPGNVYMFGKMLAKAKDISSLVELGTNVGNNLKALHEIYPQARIDGVEINPDAAAEAVALEYVTTIQVSSLLDARVERQYDLSFTKSVLIHVSPEGLPQAYEKLYGFSRRYILVCEYHNPTPVTVEYRGHRNRLFKRDFAGEMLDAFPDLELLDYGFFYNRDPNLDQSDTNWFLLQKTSA